MTKLKLFFLGIIFSLTGVKTLPSTDTRCYEMRVYYTHEGKFPDLLARFRNHTTKLFEKHGMTNVGYFVPEKKQDSCLIYFLSYPSREAREASWKNFIADTEWQSVAKKSEEKGKIVSKIENHFYSATDFSPQLEVNQKGNRVFELRTYKTTPYNLGLLMARFRNHTLDLFTKHGAKNEVYWTEDSKDDMLVYLLSHKSREDAGKTFDTFRKDPDWIAVRAASEKLAKGSLTASIQSEFLVPTDFSPWK